MKQNYASKPRFKVTQMTSATIASKHFGALRDKAKDEPQVILEHNEIDSILMSYAEYEAMYIELEKLRANRRSSRLKSNANAAGSTPAASSEALATASRTTAFFG